jgi:glucuronoarabinoxylan endo-1,4-beta-xylanase
VKNSLNLRLASLAFVALLVFCSLRGEAQSIVITNHTFDTPASANPPAWASWPLGGFQYVTNGWSSSDVSNSPGSGSLLVISTFSGANQQSWVGTGRNGDYNPPLDGTHITNFSCFIRFDGSSPTNASTMSYGSLAFFVYTQPGGGGQTQIGGYFHPPANTTNWVGYSIPLSLSANVYAMAIQLETYGNTLAGTSRMYVDNIQFTGTAIVSNPPISGASIVDGNNVHQRIDGFGASSAWNGTWNAAEADVLFSTNNNISYQSGTYNGVGLSLLRTRIAFASDTSPSSTPSTVESSIMQMAQARGAKVWSAPWTPAAGFKDSGVANGGYYLGYGADPTNLAYASQLANYVTSMQSSGINIYAISVQNEPDGNHPDPGGYESCVWNSQQIHDFTTNLYNALVSQGVSSTKIMLPESQNWTDPQGLASLAMADPAVAADIGIVANHDYVGDNSVGDQTVPAAIATGGKRMWETEVALLSGNDSSMANGIYFANRIYQYMTQAQANAYHYWWLVAGGSGNQGLLDLNAAPTKRLFAFGQYSRFVRPNFYRIDATSTQSSVLISAYKDSGSPAFAIVAVNTNRATAVVQTFSLSNVPTASVTPWITSSTLSLASQTPVALSGNSFTYTLPALSVVTFVGSVNPLTRPTITSISMSNGQVELVINGDAGPNYTVLTSTNLVNWDSLLTTNPPVLPFTLNFTNTTDLMRFYRIKLGP